MALNNDEHQLDQPQPDAPPPSAVVLARLQHLFRHQRTEGPGDRFLFELIRRYRLGGPK